MRAGRVPRRYRGKDVVRWMDLMGMFDTKPESLPSPKAKFAANPHVTGAGGGRSLNLHQFARDGVVLLGHLASMDDGTIVLRSDLHDNLAKSDGFESDLVAMIDAYIAGQRIDAPEERLPSLDDGYRAEEIRELSLSSAGITTVIWAMGYEFDFSLVKFPVFDENGYPLQNRGMTHFPGLYFMGLPWMHNRKSALLLGVGEDADFVASAILGEERV
jgi:putative flavoprotein involved in K+ transport